LTSVLNGLPILTNKVATAANMTTEANLTDGDVTVFVVGSQDSTGSPLADFDGHFVYSNSGKAGIKRDGSNNTIAAEKTSGIVSKAATNGTFYTIRRMVSGSTSSIALNNGTADTGVIGSGFAPTPLYAFTSDVADNGYKRIAEIIIYTRALDSTEIADIESYLRTKYAHY
jgi:hypothetical protein